MSKVVIGIADMKVSNDPNTVLITYSLGSCIGVVVYDPVVKVGGILHYMLPNSSLDKEKAKNKPLMFADTAIPMLFKSCFKLGAKKNRMIVKVAGGSQLMNPTGTGIFDIGKGNYVALRKMLWRNNVMIESEDIGGNVNRTISLNIKTGTVTLKVSARREIVL